jgi:hypothetical protein
MVSLLHIGIDMENQQTGFESPTWRYTLWLTTVLDSIIVLFNFFRANLGVVKILLGLLSSILTIASTVTVVVVPLERCHISLPSSNTTRPQSLRLILPSGNCCTEVDRVGVLGTGLDDCFGRLDIFGLRRCLWDETFPTCRDSLKRIRYPALVKHCLLFNQ